MKTALVVSGGGCKGAFAVGVIEYLLESGLSFDVLVGTSTGALIVPMIAAGQFDTIKDTYSNVHTSQLIRKFCCLTLPWRPSLYNDKGLRKIIDRLYTKDIHDAFQANDKDVFVCTVSLNTGGVCYWSPKDLDRAGFMRAMSASSNQPGLMPPIQIEPDGGYHVDGGVREIAPVQKAVECGADRVFAIVLEPEQADATSDEYNRIPKILLRTLDLMFVEIRKNDVSLPCKTSGVECTVIRPKSQLSENSLEFKPEHMREMIKLGYERAKEVCGTEV